MRAAVTLILFLGLLVGAGGAAASAPDASPRPLPRPGDDASQAVDLPTAATEAEVSRAEPEPLRPRMSAGESVAAASLVPLPRNPPPLPDAAQGAAASAVLTLAPALPRVAPPPRPPGSSAVGMVPSLVFAPVAPQVVAPQALRPPQRPSGLGTTPASPAPVILAVARSPRPEARPAPGIRTTPGGVSLASAFQTRPQSDLARPAPRGQLCGVRGIEGETLAPIVSRVNGCGIDEPVRVRAVEGVRLSAGALMDCQTARALQTWVRDGVIPVIGDIGGGAASLTVGSHYACRTRNNQPGARISEHGRGRAIDISSIVLADGTPITLLNGWGDARQGPILRALHRAACGPFGTVLGPNSDRFHRDHFHFDTARYRSGSYCR
jgi:hypothetical protein